MFRWAIFAATVAVIACTTWPKPPPPERPPYVMTMREQMNIISDCFPSRHPMFNAFAALSPFGREIVSRFVVGQIDALAFVTLADFEQIDPRSVYCLVMQQRRSV